MRDLNRHRQRIAALAKATRTAIILPALFGLLIFFVNDVQAAGFAVFGTFAHLVMKNYDPQRRKRLLQLLTLTFGGVFMICWATAVSSWLWLAVLSSCVAGFATQTASVLGKSTDGSRTVLLLAFLLAVTSPASPASMVPRLGGWMLSGVVAFLVILTTWISFGMVNPEPSMPHVSVALRVLPASSAHRGFRGRLRSLQAKLDVQPYCIANSARAAAATGLAVLIAGAFKLAHGFWIALGVLPVLRAGDAAAPRTFLQEQAGTLVGCIISAALVALVRSHREVYWIGLPVVAFVAAYLSTAMGFLAGQAAFTLFVVVLLNVLTPVGDRAGVIRLEDVAIGGAISLFLGFVYPASREPNHEC
jgi:Fusaric acid resistance protein-like